MKLSRPSLWILLLVISSLAAWAQKPQEAKGTIRGSMFDQKTGEPVIFSTVYLKDTKYGTTTDINGFYAIPNVPLGTYTLVSSALGYDSVAISVTISKDNQMVNQNLTLNRTPIELKAVEVTASKEEKKTEVQISTIQVTKEEITRLPSVGGEPDIAQYLQVVPGVIFTGDQGGQLYIRGGSPVQTKILMDGLILYNPFHSIGLFSVFETDIIKSVDVYTGGFNAQYGGRASAVLDVTTRDGNKKKFSGKVSGSPFIAKVLLEGPLVKQKENGSSLTYILNSRNSFLDKTSEKLYSYVDSGNLPYAFNDFYGKLSFNAGNGSKISVFGMHHNDRASFQNIADFNWKTLGIGTNYILVPGGSNTILSGTIGYTRYDLEMKEGDNQPRKSSVGGFNINLNFTYFLTAGELNYGINVNGFSTNFEFFNSLGTIVKQDQNTTEIGAFFKFRKVIAKRLVLEPGIRFDYYASLGNISPEPRLGLKLNITDWLRFKAATGFYAQNLISTRTDRDVVDLFTGFLSGPEETLNRPDGDAADHKLQKAFHVVTGIELDIAKTIEVSVEPYYKNFTQLINLNRNKLLVTESDFAIETGKAYGIDFLVKYKYKGLMLWAAYSLAYVDRFDGNQTYNPHYDRRHNVNLVGSYRFGKTQTWEVNVRWNLGSGFPFTRTQSFYEDVSFVDGIGTNYVNQGGTLGIQYEQQLNAGRLPYYHRLDLSAGKTINFNENLALDINLSVSNVYNRDNVFYFDRVSYSRVNQLPILPSLALSFSF
ncbi:MAG: TonB-dependent receptor [Chitinophagales bacterium]|nr:TonB-dependent receptor [Chitinophagales bacterium]